MKRIFLILCIGLLVSQCTMVHFKTPQPQKGMIMKSFRKGMQGMYSNSNLQIEFLRDKLLVNSLEFRLTSKIEDTNDVLVKFYKNFYFACFKDEESYVVLMAKLYDNKLALYAISDDDYSMDRMGKIVDVIPTKNVKNSLLDLSHKEFDLLIEYECFDVLTVLEKKKID